VRVAEEAGVSWSRRAGVLDARFQRIARRGLRHAWDVQPVPLRRPSPTRSWCAPGCSAALVAAVCGRCLSHAPRSSAGSGTPAPRLPRGVLQWFPMATPPSYRRSELVYSQASDDFFPAMMARGPPRAWHRARLPHHRPWLQKVDVLRRPRCSDRPGDRPGRTTDRAASRERPTSNRARGGGTGRRRQFPARRWAPSSEIVVSLRTTS
jgi:hypothetical protein